MPIALQLFPVYLRFINATRNIHMGKSMKISATPKNVQKNDRKFPIKRPSLINAPPFYSFQNPSLGFEAQRHCLFLTLF